MPIRSFAKIRARARAIGLIAMLGALVLASCSSTHSVAQKKTNQARKETKSPVHAAVKVGVVTIEPPSVLQRNEVSRGELSLAEMPKGWQKAIGVTPINSLPNCSGYPSATLYGPVSAPVLELAESAGSSTTPSKTGPPSKTASPSSQNQEEVADSAIWVASNSSVAKQLVSYLSSAQGKACIFHRDTGATLQQVTKAVPGASAVASFLVKDPTQHISEALVVFSKGRDIALVFFLSHTSLPAALLNHAVDEMASRL
jgi:hypothetical protein